MLQFVNTATYSIRTLIPEKLATQKCLKFEVSKVN